MGFYSSNGKENVRVLSIWTFVSEIILELDFLVNLLNSTILIQIYNIIIYGWSLDTEENQGLKEVSWGLQGFKDTGGIVPGSIRGSLPTGVSFKVQTQILLFLQLFIL